jgi:type VI secretion system secreted protein VgrG
MSLLFCHDNEAGTDQALFVDEMSQFPERNVGSLPFTTSGRRTGIYQLSVEKNFAPRSVMLRDYNYRQPGHDLEVSHDNPDSEGRFVMGGHWVYGAHYRGEAEGRKIARARAGELGSQQVIYRGESDCAELASGHVFSIEGCRAVDEALLMTEIEHEAVQSVFGSEGDIVPYVNRFRAVPRSTDFRPVRRTPWPRIDGLQTGIVQSSAGDTDGSRSPHIDDEGRYTVSFLFDTPDAERILGSAPVRMLQPSAGEQYGMHFPVKPGVEVLLAFIDGNPDRPLIVGAAPNPSMPSPVTATESTKSRIRTGSGAIIEFGGN